MFPTQLLGRFLHAIMISLLLFLRQYPYGNLMVFPRHYRVLELPPPSTVVHSLQTSPGRIE